MKRVRLTQEEKEIEAASLRGEYRTVPKEEFDRIAQALARRKKDAVISIRVNSQDLESIKKKAKKMGVPYQTIVAELIHQYAV